MSKIRKSKNQLRRERAKLKKKEDTVDEAPSQQPEPVDEKTLKDEETIPVEDASIIEDGANGALFAQFQNIFQKFEDKTENDEDQQEIPSTKGELMHVQGDEEEEEEEESSASSSDEDEAKPLSKRQLRKLNKVSLAELKSSTPRPQLVEWYDVDSHDPFLHVAFKSQLNCVPIPLHWTNKRDYLSGRRGVERAAFQLPKFILDTGIQDLRNTGEENESTLRQLQRDRVQPKMGKLDIDYQKLYDAFFKFQTKPSLYGFGDLFYEGRESYDEYSTEVGSIRPGIVSKDLRKALGMPEDDTRIPPPWIQVMAKIGKPPAYKALYIPGLDMEYSNDGYKHLKEKSDPNERAGMEVFGQITLDIESEEEESEEDNEVDEDDEEEEEENEEEPAYESDPEVKTSISEFGGVKSSSSNPKGPSSTSNKPLYQILQENDKANSSSLTDKGYDVSIETDLTSNKKRPAVEPETNDKKKFKF